MYKNMLRKLEKISCLSLMVLFVAALSPAQEAGAWPRQITKPGGTLVLYQPQVDELEELPGGGRAHGVYPDAHRRQEPRRGGDRAVAVRRQHGRSHRLPQRSADYEHFLSLARSGDHGADGPIDEDVPQSGCHHDHFPRSAGGECEEDEDAAAAASSRTIRRRSSSASSRRSFCW